MSFLANVPVWVFPLFILLVILGLRATKDRAVPVALICALPLLGILTLRNIIMLAPPFWIIAIAVLAYGVGAWAGMRLQHRWIVSRSGMRLQVRGEWVTLAAMMVLFLAGFALGTVQAIAPQIATSAPFAIAFCAITALASGQFLGRAVTGLRASQNLPDHAIA